MKLLLKVSYLGTHFCGYQVQKNKRTVQSELCAAAKSLFGFDCDVTGCSRTDSGVHANMFCCAVTKRGETDINTDIAIEKIPRALTAHLPPDISAYSAEWVSDEFHPRYDVKYKEYVYKIWNSPVRDPFTQGRAWHCPKKIDNEGLSRMKRAAAQYVGKKDFCSFMAADSKVEDTEREVFEAEVEREGNLITFRVRADGFLYNMVRIFVGTLIDVAYGKLEPEDIPKIIEQKDRRAAGSTAPPHGLYLNKVEY